MQANIASSSQMGNNKNVVSFIEKYKEQLQASDIPDTFVKKWYTELYSELTEEEKLDELEMLWTERNAM